MNCYLIIDGSEAILLDTGLTIHRATVIDQLENLLPEGVELSIMTLRLGEFDSICNLLPLVSRFDVKAEDPLAWGDIQPDVSLQEMKEQGAIRFDISLRALHSSDSIELPSRRLEVFYPAPRLLNSFWVHDPLTRTLFTSDAFTHVIRESEGGPWTESRVAEHPDASEVRQRLLGGRFWWVGGADTNPIRRDLQKIFDDREIETIAPAYGCNLTGAEVVERHLKLIDEALANRQQTIAETHA